MSSDGTPVVPNGIVGIHVLDDRTVRVYARSSEGIQSFDHPLRPWLVLDEQEPTELLPSPHESFLLEGSVGLRRVVRFQRWPDVWESVHTLIRHTSERRHERVHSYLDLDRLFLLADPADHWLFDARSSFFAGCPIDRVLRAQISIRTHSREGFRSRADRTEDRITAIAAHSSSGDRASFRIHKNDERALISSFFDWIQTVNPDILEAFHVHDVLLPYLAVRCEMLGIECALGRDGFALRLSTPPGLPSVYSVPGRTLLDPLDFEQGLDGSTRALLRMVAQSSPRKTSRHSKDWSSPGTRRVPPTDECRSVRAASDVVVPFLVSLSSQLRVRPDLVIRASPAFRFELLAAAGLLDAHRTIPAAPLIFVSANPSESEYRTGLFSPVADVAIVPLVARSAWIGWQGSDSDIARLLRDRLTRFNESLIEHAPPTQSSEQHADRSTDPNRLSATERAASAALLYGAWAAISSRTSRFHDDQMYRTADQWRSGALRDSVAVLELHNVTPVQFSGDVVTSQIPDNLESEEARTRFWQNVSSRLPFGLLAYPIAHYATAASLGPRILAALSNDHPVTLLRSHPPRSFEPFLRDFYLHAIELILRKDWHTLHRFYVAEVQRILHRTWRPSDFGRRETIGDSWAVYAAEVERGIRHASAPYEALRKGERSPDAGTVVAYYITGSKRDVVLSDNSKLAELWDPTQPDENTEYYLDRLRQCGDRFRILLPSADFERIFSTEDLFGFDPSQIRTLERYSGRTGAEEPAPERSIWLDTGQD